MTSPFSCLGGFLYDTFEAVMDLARSYQVFHTISRSFGCKYSLPSCQIFLTGLRADEHLSETIIIEKGTLPSFRTAVVCLRIKSKNPRCCYQRNKRRYRTMARRMLSVIGSITRQLWTSKSRQRVCWKTIPVTRLV